MAKGMKMLLGERGTNTRELSQEKMAELLSQQSDFANEKTLVERTLLDRGHMVKFSPKFHCELQPVELYWAAGKQRARMSCNYSIVSLRKCIRPALDAVKLASFRKFYRKMRDYMKAYSQGLSAGHAVEEAVKQYKSHRTPSKTDVVLIPAPQ